LTIQRDGLRAQLQTLETERQRLEAALANAEALAYQQSARPTTQMMSARSPRQYQWLMLGGGALAALAIGGGALFYRRKRRK
jgi:LPXTG-motif cell wall-anchored protein